MGTGRLLALEEPALIAYTWGEDELRWTLSEREGGCLLTLEHSFADRFKAARDGAGWHLCLTALGALLDGAERAGEGQRAASSRRDGASSTPTTSAASGSPRTMRPPYLTSDGRSGRRPCR